MANDPQWIHIDVGGFNGHTHLYRVHIKGMNGERSTVVMPLGDVLFFAARVLLDYNGLTNKSRDFENIYKGATGRSSSENH